VSNETELTAEAFDQMLDGFRPAEESVPICLRSDVLSEIGELERRINVVSADDDDVRMVSNHEEEAAVMADRIRELEAVAEANTINLRLRAVDKKRWRDAVDAHKTEDEGTGVEQTDLSAVAEDVLPESIVSPSFLLDERRRQKLFDKLSDAQWEAVLKAIFRLNRSTTTVGKSVTASNVFMRQSEKPGPAGR